MGVGRRRPAPMVEPPRGGEIETVWKYPIPLDKVEFDLAMPWGAELLTVMVQNDELCLWARVDPAKPKATRYFRLIETGDLALPDKAEYVGSCQIPTALMTLVFHIFEIY